MILNQNILDLEDAENRVKWRKLIHCGDTLKEKKEDSGSDCSGSDDFEFKDFGSDDFGSDYF